MAAANLFCVFFISEHLAITKIPKYTQNNVIASVNPVKQSVHPHMQMVIPFVYVINSQNQVCMCDHHNLMRLSTLTNWRVNLCFCNKTN